MVHQIVIKMIQENQNKIKLISKNLRYEVIFYYKKLSVIKTVTKSKASGLNNEQIRLEKLSKQQNPLEPPYTGSRFSFLSCIGFF